MIDNKKILAIIPARGGSKRLPRKNILDLAGKPLIVWTIEAALKSNYIDRVIVSTDDEEIATISKSHGADVPFFRPVSLATDKAKSVDVVIDIINSLEERNELYDCAILLQPTSPLRNTDDINNACKLFFENDTNAVISVCKNEHNPLWSNTLPENMDMSMFIDRSIINKRSQDIKQYYRLNGAIYIFRTKMLADEGSFFIKNKCKAYIMSSENSVDIDTIDDFKLANYYIGKS
jgi:CMP-N,N'-diacetyllegionaminic acid synthase